MARRAGKNDGLKIVEKAIKREQGKLAKQSSKKYAKAAAAKNADTDSDSDESMHHLESRIPRKKCYASRTVRINSRAEVVDIEDSDSEDDRKMPAKITKKRAHKAESMDTDSSDDEEGLDNKATAEEKAFLKAIDKKEKKNKSDQESD